MHERAPPWWRRWFSWAQRHWQLERALWLLAQLKREMRHMANEVQDLQAVVTELVGEVGAVETTLDTIEKNLIAAVAGGDLTAVSAAVTELRGLKDRLAAARVAAEDNDANT